MFAEPRLAIRVDASATIGTGHIKRCLSLVHALIEQGAQVSLVTRALDGVAAQVLIDAPCPVHWLPAPGGDVSDRQHLDAHATWAGVPWMQDADETAAAFAAERPDWLVVDHYAFDARWHQAARDALRCRLLVIDDTADRALCADALLDHNWAPDHRGKYAGRLMREPHWLGGPTPCPAFTHLPQRNPLQLPARSAQPRRLLAAPTPTASRPVCWPPAARRALPAPSEVVSTSANPHLSSLREACANDPGTILTLDQADLAAFFAAPRPCKSVRVVAPPGSVAASAPPPSPSRWRPTSWRSVPGSGFRLVQ